MPGGFRSEAATGGERSVRRESSKFEFGGSLIGGARDGGGSAGGRGGAEQKLRATGTGATSDRERGTAVRRRASVTARASNSTARKTVSDRGDGGQRPRTIRAEASSGHGPRFRLGSYPAAWSRQGEAKQRVQRRRVRRGWWRRQSWASVGAVDRDGEAPTEWCGWSRGGCTAGCAASLRRARTSRQLGERLRPAAAPRQTAERRRTMTQRRAMADTQVRGSQTRWIRV